jgi:hypothetical protein
MFATLTPNWYGFTAGQHVGHRLLDAFERSLRRLGQSAQRRQLGAQSDMLAVFG